MDMVDKRVDTKRERIKAHSAGILMDVRDSLTNYTTPLRDITSCTNDLEQMLVLIEHPYIYVKAGSMYLLSSS